MMWWIIAVLLVLFVGVVGCALYFRRAARCAVRGAFYQRQFFDAADRLMDNPATPEWMTAFLMMWGRTMGYRKIGLAIVMLTLRGRFRTKAWSDSDPQKSELITKTLDAAPTHVLTDFVHATAAGLLCASYKSVIAGTIMRRALFPWVDFQDSSPSQARLAARFALQILGARSRRDCDDDGAAHGAPA